MNKSLGCTGALTLVRLCDAKNAQAFQLNNNNHKSQRASSRRIYMGSRAGTYFTYRLSFESLDAIPLVA